MNTVSAAIAGPNIRLFSLARYALLEALKVSGIRPGQKVFVPAFICRDLLAPIHAVRATPCFYPVGTSLAPQSLPALTDVNAVLAVNYFGFPQALDPFRAYCADHGAILIEDNAHGFLSRDEQGNLLGSRGDLGLVSLRKTIAIPDGAALLLNRSEWIDRLPAPLTCCGDPLPAGFIVKRALRKIQNATGVRARTLGEKMTRGFRRFRTGRALPISLSESEFEIPGDPAMHCVSLEMLRKIDAANEVNRRRALYRDFHRDLRRLNIEPIFGDLLPGVAPYGYPFRADESGAAAVAGIAENKGFDCSYWPDLPSEVASCALEHYRNVYWINFLC